MTTPKKAFSKFFLLKTYYSTLSGGNHDKLSKVEKSKLKLSTIQKEVFIGLMLGDGHIQKRSSKLEGCSRFIYTQSAIRKNHVAYFHHVFSLYKCFCSPTFQPKIYSWHVEKQKSNSAKMYSSSSFTTLTLPIFNKYRSLFYYNDLSGQAIKKVPKNIFTLLTYRALAYWIMDDGSIQNKGLHLNTYGFSDQDLALLMHVLETKFKLKCSIHKHNKGKRIYIWEMSMITLKQKLKIYIIPEMIYKIDNTFKLKP